MKFADFFESVDVDDFGFVNTNKIVPSPFPQNLDAMSMMDAEELAQHVRPVLQKKIQQATGRGSLTGRMPQDLWKKSLGSSLYKLLVMRGILQENPADGSAMVAAVYQM